MGKGRVIGIDIGIRADRRAGIGAGAALQRVSYWPQAYLRQR